MNPTLENILIFLIPMSLAALMFGAMIRALCPYSRDKRKFKKAARTTAVINTTQSASVLKGAPGSRHRRCYCKLDYSYEDKSGNFHDVSFVFQWDKIPPRNYEYGDEIEVVYNESDPGNSIPWFILIRERIACATVGSIIGALLTAIAFMFLASEFNWFS